MIGTDESTELLRPPCLFTFALINGDQFQV